MTADDFVTIVEVGPRDGFQPIVPWIPTERKVETISGLLAAGLRRIEITSFANASAIPQLRDAADVVENCRQMPGLVPQVLVPTANYARKAKAAGAGRIAYVFSISEAHNQSNVRRSVQASIDDLRQFLSTPDGSSLARLNLATAFDCPFDGRVAPEAVVDVLAALGNLPESCELCLCDTTGRAEPAQVRALFSLVQERFPRAVGYAFHGHDTYGLGSANCYAAYESGVRVFDAALGGLGGCPFAPGATGNVATEDVVWMFERMGVRTGVDIARLVTLAEQVIRIPGAFQGGRVRQALVAVECGIQSLVI